VFGLFQYTFVFLERKDISGPAELLLALEKLQRGIDVLVNPKILYRVGGTC
jgi:hypothetical protein